MNRYDIGFDQALTITLSSIPQMGCEILPVRSTVGRVVGADIHAEVDSPSVNASVKDGYAVISADIARATPEAPVNLQIIDLVGAGDKSTGVLEPGKAIRVLSGAPIPEGADAVLAEEFVHVADGIVAARADAHPGRNILERGSDVRQGENLARAGSLMTPPLVSLVVAGGIGELSVRRKPRIGLLATGSEILFPGAQPEEGKLYASNMALQDAWFRYLGLETDVRLAKDHREELAEAVRDLMAECDVLLTSGGAWKGDRDLIVSVLEALGLKLLFHRVRMGPGKAVAMGMLDEKPVFCLPGGPTSNEMAFLMLALPAILKMAGYGHFPFIRMNGVLEKTVHGQADWTQFVQCNLEAATPLFRLHPTKIKSRLASMARTQALISIPEGMETIPAGATVPYFCMDPTAFSKPIG